jgi:hypothetical protein
MTQHHFLPKSLSNPTSAALAGDVTVKIQTQQETSWFNSRHKLLKP